MRDGECNEAIPLLWASADKSSGRILTETKLLSHSGEGGQGVRDMSLRVDVIGYAMYD